MSDTAGTGSLSFDPVAHCYDATRGYPPGVAEAIADAMLRFRPLAPGASALELGIGTGRIALPLLARGVNITGLDISPRMLDRLRVNEATARAAQPSAPWGRLEAALGDIAALPFAAGVFDAVVAVHVFHLLTRWREAFSEALRVLRPGAPLLLGQDIARGDYFSHPMQDEWVAIMRELGAEPRRLGVNSHQELLEEARGRGLRVDEWLVADWEVAHTPAEGFRDIAERSWSLTWLVPDDLFPESVRRLEAWARAHYRGDWETPVMTRYSFKLMRITAPES